jgi:hypothetical protein
VAGVQLMTRSDRSRRYGPAHRKLREEWKVRVNRRRVSCCRCGELIVPRPWMTGDGWVLDHDPAAGGPGDYNGPAHRECNVGSHPNMADPDAPTAPKSAEPAEPPKPRRPPRFTAI